MKTLAEIRAGLTPYPIEVEFPDISRWKVGNTGIDYAHSFDSGVPGPHVMITALTHGNEVSGAIAVDALLQGAVRPSRGRLSLVFANVEAYLRVDPHDVDASRYVDEDMNRVWEPARLDGAEQSAELARARALRPLIDTVDLLLDIHSMHEESAPLMMCGPQPKGQAFAALVGSPETVVIDAGHSSGRRMRDYGMFDDASSSKNALLVETGQHFSKRSEAVAKDIAARFLISTQAVDEALLADFLTQPQPLRQQFLQVTESIVAKTMDFHFVDDFRGLEVIPEAGIPIGWDGETAIVAPYDQCVLIQPSVRHLGPGVTVLRLAKRLS